MDAKWVDPENLCLIFLGFHQQISSCYAISLQSYLLGFHLVTADVPYGKKTSIWSAVFRLFYICHAYGFLFFILYWHTACVVLWFLQLCFLKSVFCECECVCVSILYFPSVELPLHIFIFAFFLNLQSNLTAGKKANLRNNYKIKLDKVKKYPLH